MIQKRLEDISTADVQALIDDGVREGRSVEYKASLPGGRDQDNREFLADVCSFANAGGGDLLFGVAAEAGVPTEIVGLSGFDPDKDILRLESVLRDSVEPRIPAVRFHTVGDAGASPVLIIRIPKSWAGPHMVTFRGSSRFFARSSAGKFQMDVAEIRSAFAVSEDLPERIQRWRDDRIGKILTGDTPIPIASGAKLLLHLIPLDSFTDPLRIAATAFDGKAVDFRPIAVSGWDHRIYLDGYVTHGGRPYQEQNGKDRSYCQVFRSGRIEAVCADLVDERNGRLLIGSVWYEKVILEAAAQYLRTLASLDILPPIVLLVAFIDARDAIMAVSERYFGLSVRPIDRDIVLLPDVLIEEPPKDLPCLLRPVFDAAWNACGIARSLNYDQNGNWTADGLSGVPTEVRK